MRAKRVITLGKNTNFSTLHKENFFFRNLCCFLKEKNPNQQQKVIKNGNLFEFFFFQKLQNLTGI